MEEATFFEFDSPKESSSYIKVIGVGGGGGNAVNHMYKQGIKGVDFIVCNTDEKALSESPVCNKIAIDYLGAGGNPAVAHDAAERHADTIREVLSHNTKMLFITAGMGGGTGTGASPVIAQIAKSIELDDPVTKNILVVAIVTMPFSWEGRRKREQAEAGITELRKHVDSILVINNDKLRTYGDKCISGAFGLANDILLTAAKGIAEIITSNALVTIDFRDVNTVMQHSGTALMGTGTGTGENRASDAIKAATTSVLLNDNDISGAQNALLYITFNPTHEVTMDELTDVTNYVEDCIENYDCSVIWGYGADESLGEDEMKITLIATGFEQKAIEQPKTIKSQVLEPELVQPRKTEPVQPNDDEMHIVKVQHKEDVESPNTSSPTETFSDTVETKETVSEAPAVKPFVPNSTEVKTEIQNGRERHVYPLEGNFEPKDTSIVTNTVSETTNSDLLDIRIIRNEAPTPAPAPKPEPILATLEVEPTSAPRPVPVPEPRIVIEQPAAPARSLNDNDPMSRADRIKRMHELLTNNANGPQLVEDMDMSNGTLFQGMTSGMPETTKTIGADGTINEVNSYLYNNPD